MSRSRPVPTNPAVRRFEWAGGKGELTYWDKALEQRISVPLPFEFMPLDQLATIAGYFKPQKASFYANEVRSVRQDPFEVKVKGATFERGFYRELACLSKGAKYAQSIYIAFKDADGQYKVGNLRATGSALSAWIDYGRGRKVENGKTVLKGSEKRESPVGEYFSPVFEYVHTDAAESEEAWKLDDELQTYLDQMLAPAAFSRTTEEDDTPEPVAVAVDPPVGELDPEEQINLNDIPF